MVKTISTTISSVYPGFTYKDLITGTVLTVTDVKDDLVVFDNGLEVASLDAFEPVDTTVNPALLSDKKVESYTNNGFHPRHAEGDVSKKAIKDYPHFVKLDAGRSRNVFTLANDKREVVKLEVVKTSDRGYTTNLI